MRYALIGTGSRAAMYYNAIYELDGIKGKNELGALLDFNTTRMDYVNSKLKMDIPTYKPHQFEEMIEKENIEGIIVTTKDCHHHEYIIKGLRYGLMVPILS